ncbi:hypothetical protein lerEdw1_005444 [Lerista edwardsae]|nr:hypothetical protein lerEdw1_005444 [Lerista edwardsae]
MEATGVLVNKPDRILEQLQHENLTLKEALHKSDCRDNEKITECIQKLTPLLLELVKALSGQLEHTTNVLQNTSQLLNTLQNQGFAVSVPPLQRWVVKEAEQEKAVVEAASEKEA